MLNSRFQGAPNAVICLGNRLLPDDDLGYRVFQRLGAIAARNPSVAVIDGGLQGLDLFPLVEGRRRVVFVDAVAPALAPTEPLVVLEGAAVARLAGRYGHGAGLPYLLHMLQRLCESPPQTLLLGSSASADEPLIEALAERALEMACHGGE